MCERDWLRSCKFSHRGVIDWACLLPGVIALIGQKSESCRQEIFHFMVIYFRCIRALDSARLCVSLVDFSLNLFFFHQVAEKKRVVKRNCWDRLQMAEQHHQASSGPINCWILRRWQLYTCKIVAVSTHRIDDERWFVLCAIRCTAGDIYIELRIAIEKVRIAERNRKAVVAVGDVDESFR